MEQIFTFRFTKDELYYLAHITRHLADYALGDDRPDHGLNMLKQYRTFENKEVFLGTMAKLNRRYYQKVLGYGKPSRKGAK